MMKKISLLGLLLSVLSHTARADAFLFSWLFPSFLDTMFPRVKPGAELIEYKMTRPIKAMPFFLTAQSTALTKKVTDGITTTTTIPQSVTHVPQVVRPVLADEIHAIDLPSTVEKALKAAKPSSGAPVFVNINLNGQTVTESTAIAHSTTMGDTIDWFKQWKSRTKDSCTSTYDWIKNNKKKCILYAVVGCYAFLQFCLCYLVFKLSKANNWSLWKNQATLEELYRCKQEDLFKEALEILRNAHPAEDTGTLYARFLKEANDELKKLSMYRSLTKFCEQIYLNKILFYNAHLYESIPDRISRLLFIKNSIMAAMSAHQRQ